MLNLALIFFVSLALLGFVALPLISSRRLDPLADDRDPVALDLEEERDALYRAIREIDAREDLPQARRDGLRARYEAKAAQVLRRLDEHQQAKAATKPVVKGAKGTRRGFGLPVTALALVAALVLSVSLLNGFVLPRVGSDASVTTADPLRLERGRELQRLQEAVSADPSTANLLALAEAQWGAENYPDARDSYRRLEAGGDAPNVVYRRLGFLALEEGEVARGLSYLERARVADPDDAETLFSLGDVYYFLDRAPEALAVWESYALLPDAVHDEALASRLTRARTIAPLQERATEDPSEENLLALADAYWELDQRDQAAGRYFQIVQDLNPRNPQAVRRLGMALFFSGRNEEAIQLLEISRVLNPGNLEGLLFLGNAHFSEARYEEAIDAWEAYVEAAGGPEQAGRVPSLIANARQELGQTESETPASAAVEAATGAATETAIETTTETNTETATETSLGEHLFAQNCASCHGLAGGGGIGPRLAGNPSAGDPEVVRRTVINGRGMMPGFGDRFDEGELEALTRYVTGTIHGDVEGDGARTKR